MTHPFKTLAYRSVDRSASLKNPDPSRYDPARVEDPATRVMTDFNVARPFWVSPGASLNETNQKMIDCGVRLLFVCDPSDTLLGLVTSTDTLGEKPILYVNEHGGSRGEILAKDIMTPIDSLMALEMQAVEAASVGDIVETMRSFERQHILVVEPAESGSGEVIRGLFSTSQISRQLGVMIEPSGRASTFAELEQAIAGS